jgi:hypothetical protein
VGRLLRELHTAAATFVPPADARWLPWTLHRTGPGTVISHSNIAPWHIVIHGERISGLIGWEYAGPVDPVDEVAVTGWLCCQLFDDDIATRLDLPDALTRARWLRDFLDGYGLPDTDRGDVIRRIVEFAVCDNAWFARRKGFTPEHAAASTEDVWLLSWQSRAAAWVLEHRDLIERTIRV